MSTAATTSHHRLWDPIAVASAVVVVVGGATVIGVAMSQDDSTTTAPSAPAHGQAVAPNPPSRIGLGDFTRPDQSGRPSAPLKGGHTVIGLP